MYFFHSVKAIFNNSPLRRVFLWDNAMKKDSEQDEATEVAPKIEQVEEVQGYHDEYSGIGGSYLYDPITKKRTPIIEKE